MPTSPMALAFNLMLALLAGVATAFQPGINARFADAAGHRVMGGVANFGVGLAAMLAAWLIASKIAGAGVPQTAKLAAGPWWMWTGGLLGAFFVTIAVIVTPRVGAANYLGAMIAGQLLASLVIDHFGLMGLREVPISPGRVLGVVLILGGMACVKFL